jgi:hypothetical protein
LIKAGAITKNTRFGSSGQGKFTTKKKKKKKRTRKREQEINGDAPLLRRVSSGEP